MCKQIASVYFINGSDHEVVVCYLELYEEGEVEHINGVWPVFLFEQLCLQLFPKKGLYKPTIEPIFWPLSSFPLFIAS